MSSSSLVKVVKILDTHVENLSFSLFDPLLLPFHRPLLRLVASLKRQSTGYYQASNMDPVTLLSFLRCSQYWYKAFKNPNFKKQEGANELLFGLPPHEPLPLIPFSPLDVGEVFLTHLVEYFKVLSKPLEECDCGICNRQKRKREEDEVQEGIGKRGK